MKPPAATGRIASRGLVLALPTLAVSVSGTNRPDVLRGTNAGEGEPTAVKERVES
jgi:hypothetical protein